MHKTIPSPRRTFRGTIVLIVALLLALSLLFVTTNEIWILTKNDTDANAIHLAESIALAINDASVHELTGIPEDDGTPAYENVKDRLESIASANETIAFLYVWTMRDGNLYFMADSEPADSPDLSKPGDLYEDATPTDIDQYLAGETVLTDPMEDSWGTWRSVMVPLRDPDTGAIFAFLGVDYAADAFYLQAIVSTAAVAGLITLLLTSAALLFISIRSNRRLKAARERIEEERRTLDLFFRQSITGFFIMMIDTPIAWNDQADKDALLEYVFDHQRVTRINQAMLDQYGFVESEMMARTPRQMFAHDVPYGKAVWRELFDKGHMHFLTDERRKDGTAMLVEGDYICLQDAEGRITGHFGVQNDVTQRIKNETMILLDETRLKAAQKLARLGNWEINLSTRKMWGSEESHEIYGIPAEMELMDLAFVQSMVLPEDRPKMDRALAELIEKDVPYDVEYRIRKTDTGEIAHLHSVAIVEFDASRRPIKVVGTIQDVTRQKLLETELALRNAEVLMERNYLEATVHSIGDGVISTDSQGRVVMMNTVAADLIETTPAEAHGRDFSDAFVIVKEAEGTRMEDPVTLALKTRKPVALGNHAVLLGKNGARHNIEDTASPITNREGNVVGVVLVFRDVTERIRHQNEIVYMSGHDHLTDLFNRRHFYDAFATMNVPDRFPLGVMMMDVNGLKIVNDAYGHAVGDVMLREVAAALKKTFRSQDVVARIGGDEFAAFLPNTTEEEMQEFLDLLRRNIEGISVQNVGISLAIGFEMKTETGSALDEILQRAENRMYRHKLSEGVSVRNRAIKAILATLTDKYANEREHSARVSRLSRMVGERLGLRQDERKELEMSGLFHDIGKIAVPDGILNKPSSLTPAEYEVIKTHAETGYQILRAADEYSDLAIHALCHHERWDGKGYPKGLKETEIPLFSRIIGIADAYEAMTSDRPYRKRLEKTAAIEEIRRCAGKQFDPELVKVFLEGLAENEDL